MMIKQLFLGFILISLLTCCSDACTKTIVRPAFQIGGGYYPEEKIKVPCDYDPGVIGKTPDSIPFPIK